MSQNLGKISLPPKFFLACIPMVLLNNEHDSLQVYHNELA